MAPTRQGSGMYVRSRKPFSSLGKRQQSAVRKKYRIINKVFEQMHSERFNQRRTEQGPRINEPRLNQLMVGMVVQNPTLEPVPQSVQNANFDHQRNSSTINANVTGVTLNSSGQNWDDLNFVDKLAHAFLTTEMNHTQGNQILRVLKSHPCHRQLPSDSRTLLKTLRKSAEIKQVEPGEYLHIGLEVALVRILRVLKEPPPDILEIDLHTDGAELYKKISIWPLQCRLTNVPSLEKIIGVIGIYRGRSKPSNAQDLFESLVDEYNKIMLSGGISFCDKKISLTFRFFIADAVARALVLCHKNHLCKKPCSKCHVVMIEFRAIRRKTRKCFHAYCGVNHRQRTDAEYVLRNDEDHHSQNSSPLKNLQIGQVSQVPFEYMHLVLIGDVKKLLTTWIDGTHSKDAALKKPEIVIATTNFFAISQCCPNEFARKPSILSDFKSFKATEFRQILLFTGPTFLYGVLTENIYINFLLLHSFIRCLVYYANSDFHLRFADIALKKFVEGCESIYSKSFMTYNTHGILHLVQDVREKGNLDSFSAFPYENNMIKFRKMCRKPHLPLQQIANRLAEEISHLQTILRKLKPEIHADNLHSRNDAENIKCYDKIKTADFLLSTKSPNNCIKVNNDIGIIHNILQKDNEYFVQWRKYKNKDEFYNVGISSIDVGIYLCCELQRQSYTSNLNDVTKKCFHASLPKTNNVYEICEFISAEYDQYVVVEM